MDHLSALDLSVPPQRKPDRDSFDYRPKATETWLKNLPVANLGETSRALYGALREVNQLRIKPASRLAFLERLQSRISYVSAGLRKHYPPREFPLPPKSRKIAGLAMTLLREMATGYNIIIQAALSGERVDDKVLAVSIYRAIRHTGALLVEVYGIYEPSPSGLWKVMHGLYLTAEGRNLQALPVDDPALAHGKRGTIASAYRQVLLLAAAGPYRMRHNEAADVNRLLDRWAPLSELADVRSPTATEATFFVDLGSDLPPLPAEKVGQLKGDVRALITSGLQGIIDEDRKAKRAWWQFWRRPVEHADPELARRIVISLGVLPKRQYSRLPAPNRSQVQVIVGLTQITRILADEHGLAAPEIKSDGPRFVSRELKAADKKSDDVWDLVFPTELLKQDSGKQGKQKQDSQPQRPGGSAAERSNWRLLNISAGGYCLLSDPTQSARAQVGELIALREVTDKQATHWQAGVIRWMKHVPAEGLQLGVQVLAPSPVPVMMRPRLEDGSLGTLSRGLMLPEIMAVEQQVTLVVPCVAGFGVDRKISLSGFGGDSEVMLTRQLEATGAFAQYEFRSASSVEPERASLESIFSSI